MLECTQLNPSNLQELHSCRRDYPVGFCTRNTKVQRNGARHNYLYLSPLGHLFQGVTSEVWTAPKPFMASPNFLISSPIFVNILDYSVTVLYPNVTGYTGGPITDFFLAISPGSVDIQTTPTDTASNDDSGKPVPALIDFPHLYFFSIEPSTKH